MNLLLDLHRHPVIAHRGASGLAPENTRTALQLAVSQHADALEFDVHLASDGVPVLIHDPLLERTTNAMGPVRGHSAAELSALDAGCRFTPDSGKSFPWRGRGLGIPSLEEVLEHFPDTALLIELKTLEVADPVRRILLRHSNRERVALASFLAGALRPFERDGFQLGASRAGILKLWLRTKLGLGATRGTERFYAVPDRYRGKLEVPTRRFIRAARSAGRPVHVWTVDDPDRAGWLWRQGVSGIVTNFPAEMVSLRNRLYPEEAGC